MIDLSHRVVIIIFAIVFIFSCSHDDELDTNGLDGEQILNPVTLALEPTAVNFRDDFNGPLQPGWTWIRENTATWSLTGTALRIELERGDLWSSWTNNCRNLLVRNAPTESEYVIETHLNASLEANINQALIVLYSNDDNYLRYGLLRCCGGGLFVNHVHEIGASPQPQKHTGYGSGDVFLRIEKIGSSAKMLYSSDGASWQLHTTIPSLSFTVSKVGLVAFDGTEPPSSSVARYDYFEIKPLTHCICPEPQAEKLYVATANSRDVIEKRFLQAKHIREQLIQIEPYIVIDGRGFQTILRMEAIKNGISPETLTFGYRLIALNNRIVRFTRNDAVGAIADSEFDFIEPFFENVTDLAVDCGDRKNPTPCPARVETCVFFNTEQDVKTELIGLGFHETARYATGVREGMDYTKVVPYGDCGTGPFRIQAIVYLAEGGDDCWTYNTQGPEPNPEILSYVWPHPWWVGYVRWWHRVAC